jgi:hypothetical protein
MSEAVRRLGASGNKLFELSLVTTRSNKRDIASKAFFNFTLEILIGLLAKVIETLVLHAKERSTDHVSCL